MDSPKLLLSVYSILQSPKEWGKENYNHIFLATLTNLYVKRKKNLSRKEPQILYTLNEQDGGQRKLIST